MFLSLIAVARPVLEARNLGLSLTVSRLQVLKVVRYTAKLLVAEGDPKVLWLTQLKSLDKSLGTTRWVLPAHVLACVKPT